MLGDCEAVRAGLFAQPVNTISSLAYVAVGVWVFLRLSGQRRSSIVIGGALLVAGFGSIGFHGPGGSFARGLHEAGIVAVPMAMAWGAWANRSRIRLSSLPPAQWRLLGASLGLGGLAVAAHAVGRTGGPWCVPSSWLQPHAAWHVLVACSMAAAAAVILPLRAREGAM